MNRSLDVLLVSQMSWGRNAGGPQVNYMLARELRERGHTVHKYDIDDAFPDKNKLIQYFGNFLFRWKALRYVRKHGHEYDVIQAEQGNLPFSRRRLSFDGVLVANSNGLVHFRDEAHQECEDERSIWNGRGSLLGRLAGWISDKMTAKVRAAEKTFEAADLITLINEDEYNFVVNELGYTEKAMLRYNGLSSERAENLSDHAKETDRRLATPQVAFIGAWRRPKGTRDLPKIIRIIREHVPNACFLLLGTGRSKEKVLTDIRMKERDSVRVVPAFEYEELPELLSGATVGVLPSYMEGFGLSVLEMLAARLPVVTYDVPGPRDMVKHFSRRMTVEAGEVEDIANLLVEILELPVEQYSSLAYEAERISAGFRWEEIAGELEMGVYRQIEGKSSMISTSDL